MTGTEPRTQNVPNQIRKEPPMGDKKSKKDKAKGQKQSEAKQAKAAKEQKAKQKPRLG